jgi:uncharacterized protein (TIGR02118 family)
MFKKRSEKKERGLSSKQRDRRAMMIGAGKAAAVGAVVAAFGSGLSSEARAADAKPVRCMTILYKNGPDVKFDFEYYKVHHMADIMQWYGKSIQKFELRKGLAAADGTPPPYVATLTIWIADDAAFDANNAKYGAQLAAEVPKFTNTTLMAQRDEVYAVATS